MTAGDFIRLMRIVFNPFSFFLGCLGKEDFKGASTVFFRACQD